jgi:tryptophanyl-tRNA synthetase (EC 6.1.1.2)
VQAVHLLLPQLVDGRQPTLVPVAADQDPHLRVCRDLAGGERLPVGKPAALLSEFLPALGGGKMSSSDDAPVIRLDDDPGTVAETVRKHAYSGGQESVAAHRREGGDPEVDVAFQYLRHFLEPDDDRLEQLAAEYRAGDLLSGEMKQAAIDCIQSFLADHQRRRATLDSVKTELDRYRLTDAQRRRALSRADLPTADLATVQD